MSRADYEIRPEVLQQKMAAAERFVLLDVRRSDEVAISTLPNTIHIPIEEIRNVESSTPTPRPSSFAITAFVPCP
jgi:rhodanese-related sulfurtransferase